MTLKSDISSRNRSKIEEKNSDKILYLISLGFLLLLWVQSLFHFIPQTPLTGYEPPVDTVDLNVSTWSEGQWQHRQHLAVAKEFGFRPSLVRLVNQLRFSFFDEHTDAITMGEGATLFETAYRKSICGEDYMGDSLVQVMIDSLDRFRNHLAAHNKKMVIMVAPNKWRTYADRVEWKCNPKKTNYAELIPKIRHRGYAVCDMTDIFIYDNAHQPEYALHSKQGTHWSIFGAAASIDYLRYAFAEEGVTLPKVYFDSLEIAEEPRNTDKDLHELLNIMMGPKEEELAYPKLRFSDDPKPNVLVVGDSYYWTYYYLNAHQGLFAPESKFFYYNRSMITDDPDNKVPLDDDIRLKALDEADVVLLVMSEPSLARFGYDFFRLVP